MPRGCSDAYDRQRFPCPTKAHALSGDILCHQGEFRGTSQQRRKVKPVGLFDLAIPVAVRVAFTVRAVAPQDKAGIDKRGELPA